ncbi:MAG: prolipoprotein diacylglyceryl transferase [Ilumatobacteraceae bacterium]
MMSLFASIPSPSSGSIHIGPLKLNAYGLMIALGIVAAMWLWTKRVEQRHVATRDDVSAISMWAVPAGIVGARLYHVATDWSRFSDDLPAIFKVWQGGLGIWGGITLGFAAGLVVAKRRGLPIGALMTCLAPALPLAQSIGRWGNWFNQELFGRPTTLPWALRVSDLNALAAGYPPGTTFHPTFLYESIASALLCVGLIALDKRVPMRAGRLFFFYTAGYSAYRFFIEGLRIDPAHHIGGWRLNQWVSLVVFVASIAVIIAMRGDPESKSKVTPDVVNKVARLARLDLSPDEVDRTTHQLSDMLEHFRDIDKLDLTDVVPMSQPHPLKNVLRSDEVVSGLDHQEVMDSAPAAEDGRFRVPPAIGFDV